MPNAILLKKYAELTVKSLALMFKKETTSSYKSYNRNKGICFAH